MAERYVEVVDPTDNVATLLRDVEEGETLDIAIDDRVRTITTNDEIQFGHKVALEDIEVGETVRKYGLSIGDASEPISAGDWVHTHNVESNYGRGDKASADDIQQVGE